MDEEAQKTPRIRKITVLAYGEGEDEKIFLRHLVSGYCRRDRISVQTGSAGGGDPTSILNNAIRSRRGEKRDFEFILLDTDKPWSDEMVNLAKEQGIELIGNSPCLEAFFLEILNSEEERKSAGSRKCKEIFEKNYCRENNFNEDECARLFPKSLLNEARQRNEKLDMIIRVMEGTYTKQTRFIPEE